MTIWGQTVIRNEENWVWFAIMSVIKFVDKVIVYDLGSADNTLKIVKSPWRKMSTAYWVRAALETPLKKIKRKIVS